MTEIQRRLFAMQDADYKEFHRKLVPQLDADTLIGVRMPALRAYAKELGGQEQAQAFLEALPHTYYEENNLHGFLIGNSRDYETCIRLLEAFLPYVDNWATCDSIRPKVFAKRPEDLYGKICGWMASEHPYTIRFGIEMLLVYYLDDGFLPEHLERVAALRSQEYYVNMMIAWYFATALAKQYDDTVPYLEQGRLARWTHNKTIQKAVESYRITPQQKTYLKTLRIKKP